VKGREMSTEHERHITDEVDKTLQSFDNDVTLAENPFLASRIKAERTSRLLKRNEGFLLRINLKVVVMALILLMNLITVVHYVDWNSAQHLHEKLVSELEHDFQIEQSQNAF